MSDLQTREQMLIELERVTKDDKSTIEKLPFTQLELARIEQGLRMLHDSGTYPSPFDKNQLKLLADRVGNARSDEVKRPEKIGYYRRTKGARETILA